MKMIKDIIFPLQKIGIFLFFILCFANPILKAEGTEQELVLEFYPQWYSDENYAVRGNVGIVKNYENSDDWVEYYANPSLAYALDNNWALHGGLGLHYTDYQATDNNVEIRPCQGVSHFTLYQKNGN